MRQSDFTHFSDMLDDVWGLKGPLLSAGQKAMFFRSLASYPIEEVRAGLDAHIKDPVRGRFLPMPADVIAQIVGNVADDGRPGAEEAWAMSVRAMDEAITVVWTEEMCEAFGICRPLLNNGDEIGARMAFKESYVRLLATAREQRTPPAWSASLGYDVVLRDTVLLPHVEAGRFPRSILQGPAIGLDVVLALPVPAGISAKSLEIRANAIAKIKALRSDFANKVQTAPSKAEIEQAQLKAKKQAVAEQVCSYGGTHPTN